MRNISDFINIETQTVGWLNQEMINKRLFVDDSFQRRYVWKTEDKIRLIETILLGYSIPEVYLWEVGINTNNGLTQRSIVDGQQRLLAIKGFINNEYALEGRFLEMKNVSYINKKFDELDESLKKLIFSYKFSIRMINEKITRDEIVQIFNRLNCTSYDLTPQELRNAKFNGKFLALSTILANESFWSKYNFFPGLQRRRMKDVEFVSNILLYYRQGIESELSQENLNKIYSLYENQYPYFKNDKLLFENTMSKLQDLINKAQESKTFINFICRSTHLYSFFTLISYLLEKNLYNCEIEDKIIQFISLYNSNNFAEQENINKDKIKLIERYKELSLEGTRSKINRIERFEILLKYLDLETC